MFKVEIPEGSSAFTRNVTSKKGESFVFIEQSCYVHIPGKPYPMESRLTLPRGQTDAYKPGFYVTSGDGVKVSPYGEIVVKLSRLSPISK